MKKTILTLAFAAACFAAGAQTLDMSLFLDGYHLGYRYNPAIQNEGNFIGVGEWNGFESKNVGTDAFIYRRNGEKVTGLHPSVSADEFLGNLPQTLSSTKGMNLNIFSHGWRCGDAYHTVEANLRANYNLSASKELFYLLKLGTDKNYYELDGQGARGQAYGELAYGYSRKISDIVTLGARVKLLVGLASANYDVTRLNLVLNEGVYQAEFKAELDMTRAARRLDIDDNGYYTIKIESLLESLFSETKWHLPSGIGAAADLGIIVTPAEGLTLSASLLDLGGMLWYYGNRGESKGTTIFHGFTDVSVDHAVDDIKFQLQELGKEFLESFKLKALQGKYGSRALPFTANLAAKYEMPFYKPLSAGVTGNYLGWCAQPYVEGRFVLAWNPCKSFGCAVNAGSGTFGAVWGAALNAGWKNFRLTAGYADGFNSIKGRNRLLTIGLTYEL